MLPKTEIKISYDKEYSVHQKDITILNTYTPNYRNQNTLWCKYIIELKEEIDKCTIVVGDF